MELLRRFDIGDVREIVGVVVRVVDAEPEAAEVFDIGAYGET